MSALVFMDTETTGLSLDDDIWEFAAIRREEDGTETEHHMFIQHSAAKCAKLPVSFHTDHLSRFLTGRAVTKGEASRAILALVADRPHVVGAVPNFDTERIAQMIFRNASQKKPNWHYHLIDVENLAVGYLAGLNRGYTGASLPSLPWNSDELSRACGVEPPTDERHTAMGDARWAKALYDAITGDPS